MQEEALKEEQRNKNVLKHKKTKVKMTHKSNYVNRLNKN